MGILLYTAETVSGPIGFLISKTFESDTWNQDIVPEPAVDSAFLQNRRQFPMSARQYRVQDEQSKPGALANQNRLVLTLSGKPKVG
jgi:hypothetical protein